MGELERRVFLTTILLAGAATVGGSWYSYNGYGKSAPPSAAQQFNGLQANANALFGKMRPGTAVDNPDGTVTYETDNGERYTVQVNETGSGPRFSNPKREFGTKAVGQ